MLSTLIVGKNTPLMQYVRQVAGEFDDICVYKIIEESVSSYEFARNLGTYEPDAILIEITTGELQHCSRLIKDIYEHSSRTAIIGVATNDSEVIRQAALSSGLKTVLTLPFSAEQMQQALLDSMLPKIPTGTGNLAIMLPARPGSGATVVGWNTAYTLATVFHKRVLFLDTDYYGSVVDEMLIPDQSANYRGTLLPSLDDFSWPRIAAKVEPTLDIVPTGLVRELVAASRWELSRLVQIARARYDFVLIRVARTSDAHVSIAMRQADRICIITGTDVASCNGALRRCKELTSAGISKTVIHAVINRTDTPALKTLREAAGLNIAGVLPDAKKAMHDAFEQSRGVMPLESAFGKGLQGVCQSLWGLSPDSSSSNWAWWKGGRKAG